MADNINDPIFGFVICDVILTLADLQKIPAATIDAMIYLLNVIDNLFHFKIVPLIIHFR